MSQITIVDDVLDFTEIAAAPAKRSYEDDQPDDQPEYQDEDVPLETKREEEVRVAHALTSIRISGRLPR
ncbi:MAG TPA: hypothetical protein VNX00_07345 [Herbaspirillum sp.]|nr:hypothetical protein [Herbaspirillum sp.]